MPKQDSTHEEEYQLGSLSEIFQLIETASKQLKRMQSQTLRASGLTPPQFFILSQLWAQDCRSFKDLADLLNCSRATITEIVDTLERKELVKRAPNPLDRRSLLVTLTAQGEALRHTTQALQGTFGDCCTGMEPAETAQLSRLLKKLNTMLKA
jgi:DNA-binding MarR family transcriptional regulator